MPIGPVGEDVASLIPISIGIAVFIVSLAYVYSDYVSKTSLADLARESLVIADQLACYKPWLHFDSNGVPSSHLLEASKLGISPDLVSLEFNWSAKVTDTRNGIVYGPYGAPPLKTPTKVLNVIKLPVALYYNRTVINPGLLEVSVWRK